MNRKTLLATLILSTSSGWAAMESIQSLESSSNLPGALSASGDLKLHQEIQDDGHTSGRFETGLSLPLYKTLRLGADVSIDQSLQSKYDKTRTDTLENPFFHIGDLHAIETEEGVSFGYVGSLGLGLSESASNSDLDLIYGFGGNAAVTLGRTELALLSRIFLFDHGSKTAPSLPEKPTNYRLAVSNSLRISYLLSPRLNWANSLELYSSQDRDSNTRTTLGVVTGLEYALRNSLLLKAELRSRDQWAVSNAYLEKNHPSVLAGVGFRL